MLLVYQAPVVQRGWTTLSAIAHVIPQTKVSLHWKGVYPDPVASVIHLFNNWTLVQRQGNSRIDSRKFSRARACYSRYTTLVIRSAFATFTRTFPGLLQLHVRRACHNREIKYGVIRQTRPCSHTFGELATTSYDKRDLPFILLSFPGSS